MPEEVTPADTPETPAENAPAGGLFSLVQRLINMYMWYRMFQYFFVSPSVDSPTGSGLTPSADTIVVPYANAWAPNTRATLHLFVDTQPTFSASTSLASSSPVWSVPFDYSLATGNNAGINLTIPFPPAARTNGTVVYAHAVVARHGVSLEGAETATPTDDVFVVTNPLVTYIRRKVTQTRKNLLTGEVVEEDVLVNVTDDGEGEGEGEGGPRPKYTEPLPHWKPQVTLNVIVDHTVFKPGSIPPTVQKYLQFGPVTSRCVPDASEEDGCRRVSVPTDRAGVTQSVVVMERESRYLPVLWFNEFWLYRDMLMPMNESLVELPLNLTFAPLSLMWWQLYVQMDQSFSMQESWGTAAEGESDDLKRIVADTNPYFLGLTMGVSTLHMVFDFLAFKNDISFWKNRKTVEGLSVRTLFVGFFMQLIILLYLFDNDTSWMILGSASIGIVIEAWKITKATVVRVKPSFPFISITDRVSYQGSATKAYDQYAMTYLSYILFPMIGGFSIYSLATGTHRSWYSWAISSLAGAVSLFGFILMTPQLFINYKLKSVAHLPWRVFTYKALNTFIDDMFAFIIKQPTIHRLSCFRDDIIFFIFLYQRYIYRTDYSRINEFGVSGDDYRKRDEEVAAKAAGSEGVVQLVTEEAHEEGADEQADHDKLD